MNGIIYGIRDLSSEETIYIGSTTNLYNRKAGHISYCFTRQENRLIYNYIREKTDREHFDECFAFEVLYSGEFETKQELRIKEEEFITERAPQCNYRKAFQTEKELKTYRQEYQKKYSKTDKQQDYHRTYQKTEKRRAYLRDWYRRKKLAQESKT